MANGCWPRGLKPDTVSDYLIDLSTGDSKPVTPEGTAGVVVSPDGKNAAVRGPDGKRGIWPLEGGGFRSIPGLESGDVVIGWTPEGESVYVIPRRSGSQAVKTMKVSLVNLQSGKIEPWRTIGEGASAGAGVSSVSRLRLASDGSAYAYIYVRGLSEAYVVTGLK